MIDVAKLIDLLDKNLAPMDKDAATALRLLVAEAEAFRNAVGEPDCILWTDEAFRSPDMIELRECVNRARRATDAALDLSGVKP